MQHPREMLRSIDTWELAEGAPAPFGATWVPAHQAYNFALFSRNATAVTLLFYKNFVCLLMPANGTPMFCAGDEFMNTQRGNNNPYNQDNETTWLDWDLLPRNRDVFRFFRHMIAFRKSHSVIARSRFWRQDVRWYGVGSHPDLAHDSRSLAYCLHGRSVGDGDLYVMINAYWEDLVFAVQEGTAEEWRRAVDTSLSSPDDIREPGKEVPLEGLQYRP